MLRRELAALRVCAYPSSLLMNVGTAGALLSGHMGRVVKAPCQAVSTRP
jgi:hypothetical protein